jgi:hypothetical protein
MRWPRKGIVVRLAIYVPVIGFLSWNACATYRARVAAEEVGAAPDPAAQELEKHQRVYTMPDGTQQKVYELTPEEAERLLGKPVALPDDDTPVADPPPAN